MEVLTTSENIGETIIATAYIIGHNANLKLTFYNSDGTILYTVTTSINSADFQKYSLSTAIPSDTVKIHLRIHSTSEGIIYADNFTMNIQ